MLSCAMVVPARLTDAKRYSFMIPTMMSNVQTSEAREHQKTKLQRGLDHRTYLCAAGCCRLDQNTFQVPPPQPTRFTSPHSSSHLKLTIEVPSPDSPCSRTPRHGLGKLIGAFRQRADRLSASWLRRLHVGYIQSIPWAPIGKKPHGVQPCDFVQ